MDEDLVGIITYIDKEERDSNDCQFVIGVTELVSTREDVLAQAVDLTLEYFVHHYPQEWKVALSSGFVNVKLDIVTPGEVKEASFLTSYYAKFDDEVLNFDQD